jgi:P4 family phage/plasmid primase-like protien
MDPRPKELIRFLDLLTEDAPEGYEPYLFRVQAGSKAPDTSYGSWKAERARLSKAEAVRWMEQGGNVGLAGRGPCPNFDDSEEDLEEHACDRCNGEDFSDRLINVDIDDEDETTADDLKDTLIARSRSRTGVHAWYFAADGADVPNIPTDDAGEVRANWQYVVAPGSYVETDPADVPDGEQDDAGYYTIEQETPVARLELDELPDVFQRANRDDGGLDEDSMAAVSATDEPDVQHNRSNHNDRDSKSALFDISARDVAAKEGGDTSTGERWAAIFHDSETGKNMSLSNEGLLHCWRHNVAHNGLQALCVLSDYRGDCADVGSPHKHSNAGQSCLQGEEGEHIWHAWKYAKQRGYIPDDDPVPYSALIHLCKARELCPVTELPSGGEGTIPAHAYDAALSTIQNHDDLTPGREKTREIDSSSDRNADTDAATADGGAAAAPTAADSDDGGDIDWDSIYAAYQAAEKSDDRRTPRFQAAAQLATEDDWANIEENDVLYWYNPATGTYQPRGESVLRQQLVEQLHEQYSAHEANEIGEQLRGRFTVREEDMGGPEGKIAAENCVIDLIEETTYQHSPHYNFLSSLGSAFDPDATCPRWRAFLKEVVDSDTDRQKLQEFAGYCLHHWGLPYHKALFLVGPTASGKSTFLDTINALLGEGTTASLTPQQMTSERFGGAELHGKWANIRNDIPAETVNNTGMFKELVAGDPIKAEEKYKDPFMFRPNAKHLFSANQLPETDTDDEAFYRRILLCPFPETIPRAERDPGLDEKLQAELPGILNWAIEGLQRLLANGRFTGDRSPGHTQDTWEKWGNSVSRFSQVALDDGPDKIPKGEVYAAYLAFCRDQSIPTETQHAMTRALKQEGYTDAREYVDGSQQRVFTGIQWTGRGEELITAAEGDTSGDTSDSGGARNPGLGGFE